MNNKFVHILVIVIALAIGGLLSNLMFDSLLWRSLGSGLFALLAYLLIGWLVETIKAFKDPDVQAASSLGMSIMKYRHYQKLFDEYQEFMKEHGVNSRASEEKFNEIWKQIDNPNEWRRYSKYREELSRKELLESAYGE